MNNENQRLHVFGLLQVQLLWELQNKEATCTELMTLLSLQGYDVSNAHLHVLLETMKAKGILKETTDGYFWLLDAGRTLLETSRNNAYTLLEVGG
ncbi:MAG: hypothetical protein ACRCZJ_01925 [Erysipelotrichaceae bacterium]